MGFFRNIFKEVGAAYFDDATTVFSWDWSDC
jgi:hypothetical protein